MRTQRSLTAAICLALILATGINLGWGVLVAWIASFVEQATASGFVYEVLSLRDDGLPIIDRRDGTKSEKRTLDGQPYTGLQEFTSQSGAILPGQREFLSHRDWGRRLVGFRDDANSSTFWYFVVSGGTPRVGWFEGFDGRTKQRLGFLAVDGFHSERPQRERCFPLRDQIPALTQLIPETEYRSWTYEAEIAPVWKSVHLASQDSIFRVDLKAREVHKIASIPGLVAVGFTTSASQKPRDLEPGAKGS